MSESVTPSESATPSESTGPSESTSPSAAPAEETLGEDATDGSGLPTWVWWLLAGLGLLGAGVAAVLVPRARRRGAWDADLETAEQEARWLAQELLPQLQQARSADEIAGGWRVAQGRTRLVEDQLTALASTAPDEARRIRARDLRDAVRSARQDVEGLLAARDPMTLVAGLAAIAGRLSGVLDRGRAGSSG